MDETESTSIKFEWTLRGLKNIFESSKGETKSKVTKSVKFGGGRWQILFYANSGANPGGEGGYVSLYLSCEPTAEEKDNSMNGKWVREGRFRFSFELRNIAKAVMFNAKEAHDHSFSWKTANWGWAQFARRETVYYLSNAVRQQDAFVIICTITSSPTPPPPPPPASRKNVPKELLYSVGALLDDPLYSDVEFVLPRRGQSLQDVRKIYASKRLLKRADYFDTMFSSGFAEASSDQLTIGADSTVSDASQHDENASETDHSVRHFDDSDDEDEEMHGSDIDVDNVDNVAEDVKANPEPTSGDVQDHSDDVTMECASGGSISPIDEWTDFAGSTDSNSDGHRNVRAKLTHPSSPRTAEMSVEKQGQDVSNVVVESIPGPKKFRVVVRDVAYNSYLAVLYYIYTDCIIFAPLSSSFLSPQVSSGPASSALIQNSSESQSNAASGIRSAAQGDATAAPSRPSSRREWIREWEKKHPGQPTPCSAKAVYRLADKLDLRELKERAFQYIVKSLSVENAAYEMFSSFSATFEDVRKVQVQFFLEHWAEIRSSDTMRIVWQQIRLGRHPGFEEVWPLIASNLEFKPAAGDGADAAAEKA